MFRTSILVLTLAAALLSCCNNIPGAESFKAQGPQAIPDKLVVLTFDDGCKSDVEYVTPLLRRYGFGATFFITEGYKYRKSWKDEHYLMWEDAKKIHDAGFEVGNHTRSHPNLAKLSKKDILAELEHIEGRCREYGIAAPRTFCYPGYHNSPLVLQVLEEKDYLFARRGCAPEFPYSDRGDRGPAYDPAEDHPLLIPTTGASGPDWTFEDFVWAVGQARDGKIAVLTFHGVPDLDHPWVHTDPEVFKSFMDYLRDNDYTVIAMRDLAKYIDATKGPSDPYASIKQRAGRLQTTVEQLRCEYLENPSGIDVTRPRFNWIIKSNQRGQMQSAYQIIVASSADKLREDKCDKWNSGRVISSQSVNISYGGKSLASGEKCYWGVRIWDKIGRPSPWSEAAAFEMGLLHQGDWKGEWIRQSKPESTVSAGPAPLFRREFEVSGDIDRAMVYMSGLGWSELYINGQKVSDHVLDPATTYYNNDQSFELGSRVLYVTHDVTDYLKHGHNAMGVMLGNGWYSYDSTHRGRQPFGDRPILLLQMNIEYTDGRVVSVAADESWKVAEGPITANEICLGEDYDARLERPGWDSPGYDDSDWDNAVLADTPSGKLVSQMIPPVKVMKTIKPVKIIQPDEGVYVYDFGQHFSGWTRLRVSGPRGTKLTIRHGGAIYDDGRLDTRNQRSETSQTDTYVLKGEGVELWEPRFTLHGFRYAEVTGFPGTPTLENLEGRFVRNSVETSGSFTCSNPLLNQIHENVCWTFMTSLQGIPQDAAERFERVGWLGDTGFVAEDYMYNLDTAAFWAKWLDDIKDSQRPDGDVPVVSPLHWRDIYPMWPCWKSSYPLIAWYLYQYYEDKQVLAEHYDGMKKLVEFLGTQAENYIISEGLGDHMEPDREKGDSSFRPKRTPAAITSTGYYYIDTWILTQAAQILGKSDDAKHYSNLADNIMKAFNDKFLDKNTNQYATGSQTSNAMSLHLGLVPGDRQEAVLKNLIDDIMVKNEGHLSTGILGTNALEQILGEYGRADVMYEIATKTTYPSWGYTISKGATTVWESFEVDRCSLNMKMFGSTEKFFYRDLAGISSGAPGYKRIVIKPQVVGDLRYAEGSIETIRGLVAVDWRKGDGSFEMEVIIPVNSEAEVNVPKIGLKNVSVTEGDQTIYKSGRFIGSSPGITSASEIGDYVTFQVGSGSYHFMLKGS